MLTKTTEWNISDKLCKRDWGNLYRIQGKWGLYDRDNVYPGRKRSETEGGQGAYTRVDFLKVRVHDAQSGELLSLARRHFRCHNKRIVQVLHDEAFMRQKGRGGRGYNYNEGPVDPNSFRNVLRISIWGNNWS